MVVVVVVMQLNRLPTVCTSLYKNSSKIVTAEVTIAA